MRIIVPYIPSSIEVIRTALSLGKVGEGDVLFDMGAGDGRVVLEAAKRGAIGVAVEISPFLAEIIRVKAEEEELMDKIIVIEASFTDVDLSNATVVYQYLYPSVIERLKEKYEAELRIGTRILSIDFPISGWIPVRVKRIIDENGVLRTVFLYILGLSNPSSRNLSLKPVPLRR